MQALPHGFSCSCAAAVEKYCPPGCPTEPAPSTGLHPWRVEQAWTPSLNPFCFLSVRCHLWCRQACWLPVGAATKRCEAQVPSRGSQLGKRHPAYQSRCDFFCKTSATGLLVSWSFVGYSGWLFYHLITIPMWPWEEVSVTSTCSIPSLGSLDFIMGSLCCVWVWISLSLSFMQFLECLGYIN